MKAQELRPGLWVKHQVDAEAYHCTVDEIYSGEVLLNHYLPFTGKLAGEWDPTPIEYVQPIPLSVGVLEKAGFKLIGLQSFLTIATLERIELYFEYPEVGKNVEAVFNYHHEKGMENAQKEILYVHELQNLFWVLTGKELEVKL